MAQGGFARDAQRQAMTRIKKEQEELKRSREIIAQDVIKRILGDIRNRADQYIKIGVEKEGKKMEDKLLLKQDEVVSEFIKITDERNRLLKFLLWTNVTTLFALSFVLGYFL